MDTAKSIPPAGLVDGGDFRLLTTHRLFFVTSVGVFGPLAIT